MDNDDVERIARQCEIVNVTVTDAAMSQSGAIEPRASKRQHVERQIEAKPALNVGAKQFKHASGASAEIKQRSDRFVGERGADRFFDRGVGDMQPADAVPFGGMAAEVILRCGGAVGAHGGEPLAVAGDSRIVGFEPPD